MPAATVRSRSSEEEEIVAGVRITHPDRLIYPELGISKTQLARYYEAIAQCLVRVRTDPWAGYWTAAQEVSQAAIDTVKRL